MWQTTHRLLRRLTARRNALKASHRVAAQRRMFSYERWIDAYDTLTEDDLAGVRLLARELEFRPLVSIVLPVYDAPEPFLRAAIESVRGQLYERWELCIADDASTEPHVRAVLDEYARTDPRIRVTFRRVNGGISAASNSALDLARGELVGLLDHDDMLRPHAVFMAVRALNEVPGAAYVYSDEDRIDESGRRFGPHFKPDFTPALLRCQNYICHFSVFRSELAREVGGFRSEYDGSQDWDLALRLTEVLPPEAVVHVPHVLYHWRAIRGSVAGADDAKPWALEAGRRAAEEHLRRTGRKGHVVPMGSHQLVRYTVTEPLPRVIADRALAAALARTDYANVDVLDGVKGATVQSGDLLLLARGSLEPRFADWLEIMVGHVLDEGVGAVGAVLLRSDETIVHAGVLLGGEAGFGYLYSGERLGTGNMHRAWLTRDVSAVAGCLLVRRAAFDAVRGLDASLPLPQAEIDLCLKLRRAGWRVLMAPDCVLYQREDAYADSPGDGPASTILRERWGTELADDPMHNPNLALDATHPTRLAFPPRASYPWRARAT